MDVILTDNGKKLLSYMKAHDQVFVGKDLGDDAQVKGIYLVLNSLMRYELVEQAEPVVRDFTNKAGVTIQKAYKTYQLTDLGRYFNID